MLPPCGYFLSLQPEYWRQQRFKFTRPAGLEKTPSLGLQTKKQLKIRPALRDQSQGSTLTHCDFCLHPYCPTPPPPPKKKKKKYREGCSTSLIIREQHIKIIMRHHLSLGRMATLKGLQTVKVGEGLKTMEGSYPVWGNVNW